MPGAGKTQMSKSRFSPAFLGSEVSAFPANPPTVVFSLLAPPFQSLGPWKPSDPHSCFLLKSTLSLPWSLRSPPARGATFTQTSCKQETSSPVPGMGSLPQLPRSTGKQTGVRSTAGGHSHSVTAQLSAQQTHGSGLGRGRGLECACPGVTDCN